MQDTVGVVGGFPEVDGSSGEKVEIRTLQVEDTVSEKEQRPQTAQAMPACRSRECW